MRNDPFRRLDLDREVLTVNQLNQRTHLLLEDVFPRIWVEGKLSNLAWPASDHVCFTLRDSNAQIRYALFRQNVLHVCQALRDRLAVKVHGKISLFEERGDYQLIADTVEPAGDDALRLVFGALKEKLAGEGLFTGRRKRPLSAHPRRIDIVSSPGGAVIRDTISMFRRRASQVEPTLVPTTMQGREAVAQIVRALQLADRQSFDALILARGGDSLEDLWCFNREAVAHTVAACTTPIISAVGHETDVSISDLIAGVCAPTSLATTELLTPNAGDLQQRLNGLRRRLVLRMRDQLLHERLHLEGVVRCPHHPSERLRRQAQRLDDLDMRLHRAFERQLAVRHERPIRLETRLTARHPGRTLALLRQKLDNLAARPPRTAREALRDHRQHPEGLAQTLNVVSPLATLGRGYSILLDGCGRAIRDADQTQPGQCLRARLAEGGLEVRVEGNYRAPVTLSLLDWAAMIRLSQRALTYLNEVIHHGSLHRAAQHLNINPSTVNRQLANLEGHLGVRPPQRTSQGVTPTETGELPVAYYRQQRASEEGVLSRLSALQGLRQGKVRLAVGEGFITDLVSQPLQSFIPRYPNIELEVRIAGANEGMVLVREDAVDLALVYAPVEGGELDVHVDTRQPLDLIIPASHVLAEHHGAMPMRALCSGSLALIRNSTDMGRLTVIAAQLERIELGPKLRTNSVTVLTSFVKSGIGVAFMPELAVSHEIEAGHIRCLLLTHPALRGAHAWIVNHKGRELTVATIICLEHLRRDMCFFGGDTPGLSQR